VRSPDKPSTYTLIQTSLRIVPSLVEKELCPYKVHENRKTNAGQPATDLQVQLAAERAACADLKKRIASLESAPLKQQQQKKNKTQKTQKTQAVAVGGQEALPGACEYVHQC